MVLRRDVWHYIDVTMGTMASQITSPTNVYSIVYSGADQRKHQSSTSLAFVWGIHQSPVNSLHKRRVTRKMFLFDDVIMKGFETMLFSVIFTRLVHRICITCCCEICHRRQLDVNISIRNACFVLLAFDIHHMYMLRDKSMGDWDRFSNHLSSSH